MKRAPALAGAPCLALRHRSERDAPAVDLACVAPGIVGHAQPPRAVEALDRQVAGVGLDDVVGAAAGAVVQAINAAVRCEQRSEEHTSELQSLMRISYAVFCLKKKK